MQKQPTIGVPRKMCSEDIQQIYKRTLIPKRDLNKVANMIFVREVVPSKPLQNFFSPVDIEGPFIELNFRTFKCLFGT